ncbi:MAG: helix-turn-helix domain-containing protein [Anaerolineae bacterium]
MTNTTVPVMDDEWLSLSTASELVGVHPVTLRAWANQGRVATQRTAGGHRRFRKSDLLRWSKSQRETSPGIDLLIHSALGRVRLAMDHAALPWLDRLGEADRVQHRELGRRLMTELASLLNEPEAASPPPVAETLGVDYARLARQQGLKLTEAVQACLFFRDSLVESLIQMANYTELSGAPDWVSLSGRLSEFTNTVLIKLIENYLEADGQHE